MKSDDFLSAAEFHLLTSLGLREHHKILDLGCGPLGLGRLLIPYLLSGRYSGYEKEQSQIEDGVRFEIGHDLLDLKKPQFLSTPGLRQFGIKFDYIVARAPEIFICLTEAAECLHPDGLIVASWLAGPEDYKPADLAAAALQSGLEVKIVDWPHPLARSWAVFYLPGCQKIPKDPLCLSMDSLEIVPETFAGHVDFAHDLGSHLLVIGWAIDPETHSPADGILLATSAHHIRAALPVWQVRSDIAASIGKQAVVSGFRSLIAKDQLGTEAVSAYGIIQAKRRAYLLSGCNKLSF